MTVLLVPYHQDERLPPDTITLSAPGPVDTVDASLPGGSLPGGDVWARMVTLFDAVSNRVATDLRAGGMPVVLSGDCLVANATITGVQRAGIAPAIVWFDAHGDVHTLDSSTSGYLGGTALRLALGAHPDLLAGPLGQQPLAEANAILVDARDLDPAEIDYLATSDLQRLSVEEVHPELVPGKPLILHIDLDVIDSEELPGLLIPAPNGPSRRAVLDAARRVLDTGRVIALDVACTWHPPQNDRDAMIRTRLLAELLQPAS